MKNFRTRYKIISALTNINVIGIRALVNQLPYILLPKPKEKLIVTTLYGFQMEIDPIQDNKGLEKIIYYTGTYEQGTLFMLSNLLTKNGVFVDVGANIGLMSIFASLIVKDAGKVFSFEPNPATFDILNKNIGLNNLSNVQTVPYGVGSVPKSTKIYDRWDAGRGSATLIKPDFDTDSYNIDIVTLSDYFKDKDCAIDVIKIDIEGYELEALKGAKKVIEEKSPILIVEISDNRENFEGANGKDIFEFVKSIDNYRVFKMYGSKKRASKLVEVTHFSDLPQHDNIFCMNDERISCLSTKLFKN
ncbi:FkbM family methyltransferase [bacterium]|nr:FkbM family methyltransferase [bacterium]